MLEWRLELHSSVCASVCLCLFDYAWLYLCVYCVYNTWSRQFPCGRVYPVLIEKLNQMLSFL